MKICPKCGSTFDDEMRFCVQCGIALEEAPAAPAQEDVTAEPMAAHAAMPGAGDTQEASYQAAQPDFEQAAYAQQAAPDYAPPYQAPPMPPHADPDDHTLEMDPADIAENKLYAMLPYLLGPIGIVIALLKDKDSAFLKFHIKLSVQYLVVNAILSLITVFLCWTIVLPIAASICMTIVFVLEIITFVQVCKGQAKDPAIIKNIAFLK